MDEATKQNKETERAKTQTETESDRKIEKMGKVGIVHANLRLALFFQLYLFFAFIYSVFVYILLRIAIKTKEQPKQLHLSEHTLSEREFHNECERI